MCDGTCTERWSTLKFLKGLFFNKLFICFAVWAALTVWVLAHKFGEKIQLTIIISFAGVTLIWMLYEAWKKFIEGGKLEVSAKAEATIRGGK